SLLLAGTTTWVRASSVWFTWWLGDMGGAFVVAPALVLWSNAVTVVWTRAQKFEAACLFVLLLAAGQAVFGWLSPVGPDPVVLKFLCMPVLAWIAYRFDPRTAATAVFLLGAIAVLGTVRTTLAMGPGALNTSLQLIQVFLAVTAV